MHGEFTDYFASKCTGVEVSIGGAQQTGSTATYGVSDTTPLYGYEMNSGYYLGSLTADESALLKKCLGDSDGNDSYGNNVEVYDWDYGSYKIGGPYVPSCRLRKRWCVMGEATISTSTRERMSGMMRSSARHRFWLRASLSSRYSAEPRWTSFHGAHGSFAA